VTRRSAASRERSRQIRLWAEQRGFALSPHGRLPGNVIQQYDREHGGDRSAEAPTRRLAGQRASSSRQARKTSASARSPRRRAAPRGALRGRARQPAGRFRLIGTGLLTRPSRGASGAGTIPASATYGSGPGSSCLSQCHPPGCPPSRPQPARREGSWNA
jgi:hypothetical protein